LARGLVTEPDIIFADEPTGSLDSASGEHVMNLLTRAVREQGTTVIIVTHDAPGSPPMPPGRSSSGMA
jgi:putative ABC transport system ATP-binding protein